jgi:hypothetical protein
VSGVRTFAAKRPFNETNAAESDLTITLGHELMEYFLRA